MTDYQQFDADLNTIGWSTPVAAEKFGKDPRWIARMRKGEVALNPEIAAWTREMAAQMEPMVAAMERMHADLQGAFAAAIAASPPPKPPRVWRGSTAPRPWRRRKVDVQGEGEAAL